MIGKIDVRCKECDALCRDSNKTYILLVILLNTVICSHHVDFFFKITELRKVGWPFGDPTTGPPESALDNCILAMPFHQTLECKRHYQLFINFETEAQLVSCLSSALLDFWGQSCQVRESNFRE